MIFQNGYHTAGGYDCLNSCICNYLKYYGFPLLTSDLFFLGDGFSLTFYDDKGYFYTSAYQSNYKGMQSLGIYSIQSKSDENNAIAFLEDAVVRCVPIAIRVSAHSLTHSNAFLQGENSMHYMNIIGKNDRNQFYISDGFIPTYHPTTFEGWVDAKNILCAWQKEEYEYTLLHPKLLPDISTHEIRQRKQRKMIDSLDRYLLGGASGYETYGKDAVYSFCRKLKDVLTDSLDVKKTLHSYNYQLRIWGFMACRWCLRHALFHIADEQTIFLLDQLIDIWNKMCLMILKASFLASQLYLDKVCDRILAVSEQENKLFGKILGDLRKVH